MKISRKQPSIPEVLVPAPVEAKEERVPALKRILSELSPIDWQIGAYEGAATWRLQFTKLLNRGWRHDDRHAINALKILGGMKVSENQYVEISAKKIAKNIMDNNLIICRLSGTFFLYDGRWWEFSHAVFEDFLSEFVEKLGGPAGLGAKLLKEFFRSFNSPFLDDNSLVAEVVREEIKKERG